MSIKYIMLSAILCCFTSSIVAQDIVEQLPSEETRQEIENRTTNPGMSTRSKPGGGPGLGEVETPISDYSLLGLLAGSLAYVSFVYIRNKKRV